MANETRRKRTMPLWTALLVAVLLVGGYWAFSAGLPAVMTQWRGEAPVAQERVPVPADIRRYDPANPTGLTEYGGHRLVAVGEPMTLNKDDLAPIGQTNERYILYSTTEPVGGGGGGTDAYSQDIFDKALGPVYIETVDGRFIEVRQAD